MNKPQDQKSTILIVPGLRDHVPDHWQTLLAAKLERVKTVPPLVSNKLSCAERVESIQRTIESINGPIIVVAHSAGVIMMAHWAVKYQRPIKGVLLATPPDLTRPMPQGYPTLEDLHSNGWLPVPQAPLPFASIVAASENDPLASCALVAEMAKNWNSTLVNLGQVGHLNPASGFGEWTQAMEFIERLENPQSDSTSQ